MSRRWLARRVGERLFGLASRAFPRWFRDRYADELLEGYRERHGQEAGARGGTLSVLATLADTTLQGLAMRVDGARALMDGTTGGGEMGEWVGEIRVTLRGLARRPAFAIQVVVTVGLGAIGVAAAYPVLHSVVLRPLPYAEPGRLVTVRTALEDQLLGVTPPEVTLLAGQGELLEGVAAVVPPQFALAPTWTDVTPRERLRTIQATPGIFEVLGVSLTGPGFDRSATAGPEVVLSRSFRRARFGDDPSVLGRSLSLDGVPHTVVGVLPERFDFPLSARPFDVWVAHRIDPAMAPETDNRVYRVVGRLADGVTREAAAERVEGLLAAFHETEATGITIRRTELRGLHEDLVGSVRMPLFLLSAAALLVLVVASLNVALLLSARNLARGTELAVRGALGAGRGRLTRFLLTEAGVITVLGTLLGAAVATGLAGWAGGAGGLAAVRYGGSLDGSWLPRLGAVLLALAVMVLATTVPAGKAARSARLGVRTPGGGRGVRRSVAVIVGLESALVFGLLVMGGVAMMSLDAVTRIDPGFESAGALAVELRLPQEGYRGAELPAFFETAAERAVGVPEVVAAGSVTHLPLDSENWGGLFAIEGRDDPPPDALPMVDWEFASPGYFAAVGIPLLEGRPFRASDDAEAPLVAIINRTLAERYWPDGGAVGSRVNGNGFDGTWFTVVGVVGDVKQQGLEHESRGYFYMSSLQSVFWPERYFVVRTAGSDPLSVWPAVRAALLELEPLLTVGPAFPLDDVVTGARGPFRLRAVVLGAFALIGALLGMAGIYGVASHAVQARRREVGLRLAVGADGASVFWMMLVHGLTPVLVGMLGGVGLALLGGRWLEGVAYGVRPADPGVMATVAALLTLAALAAALPSALRARRTDPVTLLRSD